MTPAATPSTMLLGAHVSAAGGVDRAIGRARDIGAECFQLFTRNHNRWSSPPISEPVAARFRDERARAGLAQALAHDSYLINLAGTDADKLARSRAAFVDELCRADQLGLDGLVAHPGSHLGDGVATGLRRFTAILDRCLDEAADSGAAGRVTVLLETTAGQGTNLGAGFDELRDVIGGSRHPERLGVCVDTCHVFAAGYDLRDEAGYEVVVDALDAAVGLDRVRAWHLNDSRRELGSRVDRHADLGEGELGFAPFARLVTDPRWAGRAGCLETPGGPDVWAADLRRLKAQRSAT